MTSMYQLKRMPAEEFMSRLQALCLKSHNVAYTENGAKVFGSTGSALLDLNFSLSSLRRYSEHGIASRFVPVMEENPELAIKWLFYCRDIREGLGERHLFKVVMTMLAKCIPDNIRHLIPLIPVYGCWSDLWVLFDTPLEVDMLRLVKHQFGVDMAALRNDGHISLLGKWMPSINSASKDSRQYALRICRYMGMSVPVYRKSVGKLRAKLDVVEKKMSANMWGDINYSNVPSKANMLYAKAFIRHDRERREKFLHDAYTGKSKINAAVLFPHEIIHGLMTSMGGPPVDINFFEAMWNALPKAPRMQKTLIVSDGSRSMIRPVQPQSRVRSLDIAIALSIYFSQFLEGPFKDKFITFSEHPQLVDLSSANNLLEKINIMEEYTEVANTNIEAVFDLILQVWYQSGMNPEVMPDNIIIVSDMQFDICTVSNDDSPGSLNPNLFETIQKRYGDLGAKLPRCCFWNTRGGAENGIPMIKNDLGVALMSGFSINNMKTIMSSQLDPYEALVEILTSERYEPITISN